MDEARKLAELKKREKMEERLARYMHFDIYIWNIVSRALA